MLHTPTQQKKAFVTCEITLINVCVCARARARVCVCVCV